MKLKKFGTWEHCGFQIWTLKVYWEKGRRTWRNCLACATQTPSHLVQSRGAIGQSAFPGALGTGSCPILSCAPVLFPSPCALVSGTCAGHSFAKLRWAALPPSVQLRLAGHTGGQKHVVLQNHSWKRWPRRRLMSRMSRRPGQARNAYNLMLTGSRTCAESDWSVEVLLNESPCTSLPHTRGQTAMPCVRVTWIDEHTS